ncbi:MAG: hypothetical protein ACK56I_14330, partial [bacterium]
MLHREVDVRVPDLEPYAVAIGLARLDGRVDEAEHAELAPGRAGVERPARHRLARRDRIGRRA